MGMNQHFAYLIYRHFWEENEYLNQGIMTPGPSFLAGKQGLFETGYQKRIPLNFALKRLIIRGESLPPNLRKEVTPMNQDSKEINGAQGHSLQEHLGKPLSARQLAPLFGLSYQNILLKWKELGGCRIGKRIIFFENEVIQALEAQERGANYPGGETGPKNAEKDSSKCRERLEDRFNIFPDDQVYYLNGKRFLKQRK